MRTVSRQFQIAPPVVVSVRACGRAAGHPTATELVAAIVGAAAWTAGAGEVARASTGVHVGFDDAGRALECASSIQRAIAAYALSRPGLELSVAIGVHEGDAAFAALLAAVAGWGEILASGAALAGAAHDGPDGIDAYPVAWSPEPGDRLDPELLLGFDPGRDAVSAGTFASAG